MFSVTLIHDQSAMIPTFSFDAWCVAVIVLSKVKLIRAMSMFRKTICRMKVARMKISQITPSCSPTNDVVVKVPSEIRY